MDQNPAKGTMPASASEPMTKVQKVFGMYLRSPPMSDMLLECTGVDHRPGAEEQQRLEEGVGEQVEQPGGVGAGAHGGDHVAELRQRRVGEHLLDVVLLPGP